MSGWQVTKRERTAFEWHALLLFELAFVLAIVNVAWMLGRTDSPATLLAAALPSAAVVAAIAVALLVRWWWAPAAAVGLLWVAVVQGGLEVAIAFVNGGLTIPIAAIIAGLILWVDRPRLSDRGRPWAWGWAAVAIGAWAFGVLVIRWAWLSTNWW